MYTLGRSSWRALCGVLLLTARVHAEGYELGGTVHTLYAVRVREVDCEITTSCRLPLAEERLHLRFSGSSEATVSSSFLAAGDLVADQVTGSGRFEPREINAELTAGPLTVRAGRQILSWGIGDYVFLNDVFPKNWESLFLGRPAEYLKEPSAALRLSLPHLDLIVTPVLQADVLPTPERFYYSDPLPAGVPRVLHTPTLTAENAELALRISGTLGRFDLAAYASRGFAHAPVVTSALTPEAEALDFGFARLNTVGFSVEGPVLDGLVGVEVAYYDSVDDRSGIDPMIDNSELRVLTAYSRPLWEDAQVGIQLFAQAMAHHEEYLASLFPGMRPVEKLRLTVTGRFTQLMLRQLLQLNVFALGGLSDEDGLLLSSLRYSVTDALSTEVGANVFLGRHDTTFGRFRRNTNVFFAMHYGF